MNIKLKSVELPEFGLPLVEAQVEPATYLRRQQRLREAMRASGMDALIVYADREHNANLAWLCGYDPRFEEALLVFGLDETPLLLVGNEGWGYAELCPSPVRRKLCWTGCPSRS